MSERINTCNAHICEYMPNNLQIVIHEGVPYILEVKFSGENSYRELSLGSPIHFCPWCGERLLDDDVEILKHFSAPDVFPDNENFVAYTDGFSEEANLDEESPEEEVEETSGSTGSESLSDNFYGSITPSDAAAYSSPIRKPTFDFSVERHRIDE